MNNDDLVLRQQRLLARSAELRGLDPPNAGDKRPLVIVDQAQAALHWLARNPTWPLGGLLVLTVVRPRRAVA